MKIPIIYNVRSMLHRPATTAATAVGIALVVVTFVGMLALANGFRSAMVSTGRPDNVLVLREGADAEISSGVSRETAQILAAFPDFSYSTADVFVVLSKPRVNGTETHMPIRGVGPDVARVRDEFRIVEGRMFEPGRPEVVTGVGLVGRMQNVAIGETLRLGQQDFTVVGHFEAGGGAFESEVWGDAETLMPVFRGPVYQSVTLRLADPSGYETARARIEGDPRLQVQVKRESDFYEEQSAMLSTVLQFIAVFVTSIMAVGAVFGAINTMDAMVASRGREIALLQTLGFRPGSVLGSFMIEAILLALVGGVLGCLLALPINGIRTSTTNWQSFGELTFAFRITPQILLMGLGFAVAMGIVGGFLPARRASRQVAAVGLRRE